MEPVASRPVESVAVAASSTLEPAAAEVLARLLEVPASRPAPFETAAGASGPPPVPGLAPALRELQGRQLQRLREELKRQAEEAERLERLRQRAAISPVRTGHVWDRSGDALVRPRNNKRTQADYILKYLDNALKLLNLRCDRQYILFPCFTCWRGVRFGSSDPTALVISKEEHKPQRDMIKSASNEQEEQDKARRVIGVFADDPKVLVALYYNSWRRCLDMGKVDLQVRSVEDKLKSVENQLRSVEDIRKRTFEKNNALRRSLAHLNTLLAEYTLGNTKELLGQRVAKQHDQSLARLMFRTWIEFCVTQDYREDAERWTRLHARQDSQVVIYERLAARIEVLQDLLVEYTGTPVPDLISRRVLRRHNRGLCRHTLRAWRECSLGVMGGNLVPSAVNIIEMKRLGDDGWDADMILGLTRRLRRHGHATIIQELTAPSAIHLPAYWLILELQRLFDAWKFGVREETDRRLEWEEIAVQQHFMRKARSEEQAHPKLEEHARHLKVIGERAAMSVGRRRLVQLQQLFLSNWRRYVLLKGCRARLAEVEYVCRTKIAVVQDGARSRLRFGTALMADAMDDQSLAHVIKLWRVETRHSIWRRFKESEVKEFSIALAHEAAKEARERRRKGYAIGLSIAKEVELGYLCRIMLVWKGWATVDRHDSLARERIQELVTSCQEARDEVGRQDRVWKERVAKYTATRKLAHDSEVSKMISFRILGLASKRMVRRDMRRLVMLGADAMLEYFDKTDFNALASFVFMWWTLKTEAWRMRRRLMNGIEDGRSQLEAFERVNQALRSELLTEKMLPKVPVSVLESRTEMLRLEQEKRNIEISRMSADSYARHMVLAHFFQKSLAAARATSFVTLCFALMKANVVLTKAEYAASFKSFRSRRPEEGQLLVRAERLLIKAESEAGRALLQERVARYETLQRLAASRVHVILLRHVLCWRAALLTVPKTESRAPKRSALQRGVGQDIEVLFPMGISERARLPTSQLTESPLDSDITQQTSYFADLGLPQVSLSHSGSLRFNPDAYGAKRGFLGVVLEARCRQLQIKSPARHHEAATYMARVLQQLLEIRMAEGYVGLCLFAAKGNLFGRSGMQVDIGLTPWKHKHYPTDHEEV